MNKNPFLAIGGLAAPSIPDQKTLATWLGQLDPERTYTVADIPLGEGSSRCGLLVDVEGAQFTIVPRDTPEAGRYASAVAGAVLTWGGAAQGVVAAKAEIVVAANRRAADHAAAVKTAFLLAVVVGAVASRLSASFVYWGTADPPMGPVRSVSRQRRVGSNDGRLAHERPCQFRLARAPARAARFTASRYSAARGRIRRAAHP